MVCNTATEKRVRHRQTERKMASDRWREEETDKNKKDIIITTQNSIHSCKWIPGQSL